ncbi:uncharacterized protein LOC141719295 [Apium graveolens]|uniref:uncharacterized protein LOC141719295 n=1 Tax=Apium graveolens TaxID=4045 RepID=UPI003D795291
MKGILSRKLKLEELETVAKTEECSAVLQQKLPPKLKDPGSFTIACTIGNLSFDKGLCDLGASINMMPLSVFMQLGLPDPKPTNMSLQLADRSITYPRGIVEDVLVKVDKIIFPVDFVILDFEEDKKVPIILGRPFLATDEEECFKVEVLEAAVNFEIDQLLRSDVLERVLIGESDFEDEEEAEQLQLLNASPWRRRVDFLFESLGIAKLKNFKERLKPSIEEAPKLELKPLSDHLRYAFLGDSSTFPVIIAANFSGYNQICITPEDQEKTTFTCPFGTFAFRRVSFRLCGAPTTFQRCMMAIFSGMIGINMEVFMDDFYVFGSSYDECLHNLGLVFKRCVETNLVLNWEKCHFMDFSKISKPLCNLLEKDVPFKFDEECLNAFEILKKKLTTTLSITVPDWSEPFEMMCDASDFAFGVVLGQRKNNVFHVIYYSSKTLNDAQLNYTTMEKALLVVVFGFEKFRSYLLGTKEFELEIKDRKGTENQVADHLSRLEDQGKASLDTTLINESFSDEQLFVVREEESWFANIVNYLVSNVMPAKLSYAQRKKFLHEVKRNQYILLAVDYMSKWVEIKAIPTNDDVMVINFLEKYIFTYFGIPRVIISGEGSHFCNRKFAVVIEKYGVNHRVAITYHPQMNGQVVSPIRKDWTLKLDEAVWAYRTAYKTPLRMSPYQLVYGKAYHLPVELEHKAYWELKKSDLDMTAAGKLKSRWSGPFTVKTVFPHGAVEIFDKSWDEAFKVNAQRLKIYYGETVNRESVSTVLAEI